MGARGGTSRSPRSLSCAIFCSMCRSAMALLVCGRPMAWQTRGHRACVSPGPYADARALDEGGCWKKTLQILLQRWDARNFLRDAARKGGLGLGSGFPPGMSRVRSQLMYAGIQHGSRYAWSRA